MLYTVHMHSSAHEQLQAHEQRLPLPGRTPTMLPTRAHMSALIRQWERMDMHRRKRTHVCTLTLQQVECDVARRIAHAAVAAHVRAQATVVVRRPPHARERACAQAPRPGGGGGHSPTCGSSP